MCEDPKTGEMIMQSDGPCPRGYIERAQERVRSHGILWRDHRNDE